VRLLFLPSQTDFRFELQVLAYFAVVMLGYQAMGVLEPAVNDPSFSYWPPLALHLAWSSSFLAFNCLMYWAMPERLITRCLLIVLSGAGIGAYHFAKTPGIIDPVYFFLMSASCAFTLGFYRGRFLGEEMEDLGRYRYGPASEKLLDYLRDVHKFIMRSVLQGWLALGASVGVSMSILFRDGWTEPHLKYMAVKMVAGFGGITLAVVLWIAVPFANQLLMCHRMLPRMENGPRKADSPVEMEQSD
jgi:hypothetical protein